jgi:[ribosomal protein S18]-alanine N-acetyltransferase
VPSIGRQSIHSGSATRGFDTVRQRGIILSVTIRPMTEADLDQVMELEKAIFANPWRRSFFLSDLGRSQGLVVVAEEDAVILGYAVAWGTEETHLANLAVSEHERGKGVGGRLLDEVIAFARRSKAQSMYLEVRVSNTVARKFYSERGFVPTYLRKGYYENGEDAVIMEREVETQEQG